MGKEGISAVLFYFAAVIAVGIYFFWKGLKNGDGEKQYFLGGRSMNAWVSALSAGASDMSAWVLMGLPGAIYFSGLGQVWIAVGLLLGTFAAWVWVAPRLRRYSILAGDAITIPQFLSNRFKTSDRTLQTVAAVVFMVTYCVYAASSIYACGLVFNTVTGMPADIAMMLATVIIVAYTFLGGFNAVCWTDFFQGMMMLCALMAVPIIASLMMTRPDFVPPETAANALQKASAGGVSVWNTVLDILNGLGWGLGYFGMPHILIRYFAVRSEKEMRKSQIIGCLWILLILSMAVVVGLMGKAFLGAPESEASSQLVFIDMVHKVFVWAGGQTGLVAAALFLAGLLLSAILAASMSTADSQLLASSSAFASDMYKPLFRKKASDREMMWAGRIVVLAISVAAYSIAVSPECKGIMALVSCAWAAFGAAFGPVILLALYWKRFTYRGAIAGTAVGFLTDGLWYGIRDAVSDKLPADSLMNLYEIIPGFFLGLLAAVVFSLLDKAPPQDVCLLFDRVRHPAESEK